MAEIAGPVFGDKNHLGIDRRHGFLRRFVVTGAAHHASGQRGAGLDPGNTGGGVWAGTAYRSRATLALLDRRGLRAAFQRAKPRGRPLPAPIAHGNPTRARVRGLVGQVFATEKRRIGLVLRCIGLLRATARITPANRVYNRRRLPGSRGPGCPPDRSWQQKDPTARHQEQIIPPRL